MQPPPDAFIVTIAETPAREITIADVVFGSLGIVGVLVLAAVLLGGGLSLLLVFWNKRHPPEDNHMPPVTPVMTGSTAPPSYRVQ